MNPVQKLIQNISSRQTTSHVAKRNNLFKDLQANLNPKLNGKSQEITQQRKACVASLPEDLY